MLLGACGHYDLFPKRWIAVESRSLGRMGRGGHRSMEGIILDIKQNTGTVGSIFSDSLFTFDLNKVNLSVERFGKIHFASPDSLVIDYKKISTRTRFIPIADFKPALNGLELAGSAWFLNGYGEDDWISQRIDFTAEKWKLRPFPGVAITHRREKKYKYQKREKWSLKRVQEEWFLTLSYWESDMYVFQVAGVDQDSLTLKCLMLGNQRPFTLCRLKKVDPALADSIVRYLAQRRWNTREVLNQVNSMDKAEDSDLEIFSRFHLSDTTVITKRNLMDKKVSFRFRDDFVFEMLDDSRLFWQTTWRLSEDGNYIILDKGQRPSDYIEIISWKNNELVIGKEDDFATDEKHQYYTGYYEVRLN
ncbi:MAG TPA: hypothetical protein DDZ56_07725 [Cytophagales bacterium]|nr:hypothetical protein [Cytophagales bacterium]